MFHVFVFVGISRSYAKLEPKSIGIEGSRKADSTNGTCSGS